MTEQDIKGFIQSKSHGTGRDIRKNPKTGEKSEGIEPHVCMCCGKKIYIVFSLVNGDEIGSECESTVSFPVCRGGKKLSVRQVAYLQSRGLVAA